MHDDWTHEALVDCLVNDLKADVPEKDIQGCIRIHREGHCWPEKIADPAGTGKKRPDVYAQFTRILDPDDGPNSQLVLWDYIGEADIEIDNKAREQIVVFMRHAMDQAVCRFVVAVPPGAEKDVEDTMFSAFQVATDTSDRSKMKEHIVVRKASCGAVLVEFWTNYPLGVPPWN